MMFAALSNSRPDVELLRGYAWWHDPRNKDRFFGQLGRRYLSGGFVICMVISALAWVLPRSDAVFKHGSRRPRGDAVQVGAYFLVQASTLCIANMFAIYAIP